MELDTDLVVVLQRAQRACAEIAAVRATLAATVAETRQLVALARQASLAYNLAVPAATPPPSVAEPLAEADLHVLAMEVLRIMRELLNEFSAEWQVEIVKAITMRTLLIVAAQLDKPVITPSA